MNKFKTLWFLSFLCLFGAVFYLAIYSKHFAKQQRETKILETGAEAKNGEQSQVLPGSIAVFDVEMLGGEHEVDNWAFGLADLMTSMLEEKGGTVLERQDLRYVLSERQLQRAGLLKPGEIIRRKLPWVKYLAKGTLEKTGASEFLLTVYVNDTESGLELARFTAAGPYPNGLAKAVGILSDQVLAKLGRGPSDAAPKRESPPGFTLIPEAAALFYKGIEHYINGRPEFAVEYFHQAYETDPRFLVAMVWRKRAYERLGLAYLGNAIYQTVSGAKTAQRIIDLTVRNDAQLRKMTDQEKHAFFVNKLKEQNKEVIASVPSPAATEKRQLVVAISKPVLSAKQDPELEQCLRKALEQIAEVRVFSPESIRALASEIDMPISEEFSPHQLQYQPWVAVDAVMTIAAVIAVDNMPQIRVDLIDALSGELVTQAEKAVASGKLREACQDATEQVIRERGVVNGNFIWFPKLLPLDYRPIAHKYSSTTQDSRYFYLPQNYAYTLRSYADHPNDKVQLIKLLDIERERKFLPSIEQIEAEKPYREALQDQLLRLIDKKESDAPNWLSEALFDRYYDSREPITSPASLVAQLKTLVQEFPDSVAAIGARYALGHAAVTDGRWEEGADLFIDVAKKLDTGSLRPMQSSFCETRIRANVYFLVAGAAAHVGKTEFAKEYITRALEIAQKTDIRPAMIVVVHKGLVTCRDASIYADEELIVKPGERMNDRIQEVHGRLNGAKEEFVSLDSLYQQFRDNAGEARNKIGWRFFEVLLQRIEARLLIDEPNYNVRPVSMLGYLYQNTPEEKRGKIVALARKLIKALNEKADKYKVFDSDRYSILIAVGLQQEALDEARSGLSSPDAHTRFVKIKSVAWILHEMGDFNGELKVLRDEVLRFHKDFRKPYDDGILSHVNEQAELDFIDLIYRAAFAHRDARQENVATELIRLALNRLFSERTNEDLTNEHRASLKYHLACIEEKMGNKHKALELLKEVAEVSQNHPNYSIYFYNYAEAPARYLYSYWVAPHVIYQGMYMGDMHPSAVKHIERLRDSLENASSNH